MNLLAYNLGVSFCKWGFPQSSLKDQPVDREYCKSFIELNDCIMKKVMYHRGSPKQRMFIKTHLLIIARELEQRYDRPKFLTIVRDPVERFRNFINFAKVDGPLQRSLNLFHKTWRVACDWVIETQICYCDEEMIFYNRDQCEEYSKNKLTIPFDIYASNLADTFQRIYSFLNIPVSAKLLSKATELQKSSHDRIQREELHMIQNIIGAYPV